MDVLVFLHDCGQCGMTEGRVWTDSYTGKELCNACLSKVIDDLANEPGYGDNLKRLLKERVPQ